MSRYVIFTKRLNPPVSNAQAAQQFGNITAIPPGYKRCAEFDADSPREALDQFGPSGGLECLVIRTEGITTFRTKAAVDVEEAA